MLILIKFKKYLLFKNLNHKKPKPKLINLKILNNLKFYSKNQKISKPNKIHKKPIILLKIKLLKTIIKIKKSKKFN